MTVHHMIFQPTLSGNYDSFEEIPLDWKTPRGMFLGTSGSRYLVCDDPWGRFAVALRHAEYAPFTRFTLGELAADTGSFCGVGKFHLGNPLKVEPDPCVLGSLDVEQDLIRLFVKDRTGCEYWQIVAYGTGGAHCCYDDWTLMVDDDMPFFSSDGVY